MEKCNYYKFLLVGNKIYINQDQNLIKLFLVLYWKMRPLSFLGKTAGWPLLNRFPGFITRAVRVVQFVYDFYRVKVRYQTGGSLSIVQTKCFGHCLLKLRQGEIKVFDLKQDVVTTVFVNGLTEKEVRAQINTAQKAANCKLAPELIQWNEKDRYMTEKYINLSSPSYDFNNLATFYSEVFPILIDILSTTKPKKVDFVKISADNLFAAESILHQFESKYNCIKETQIIRHFINEVNQDLNRVLYRGNIDLVLSHGDFWEGNILAKRGRYHVIDWMTIGFRTLYFDFYYVMFMQASKKAHLNTADEGSINDLHRELDMSCQLFLEKLKRSKRIDAEQMKIPEQFTIYRYLFYLELIILKLNMGQPKKKGQLFEVITWIKRFKLLEEKRKQDYQYRLTK
ncbi:hypothetical protein [Virgibacillus litoralis]|uniref:Thiamine kinase-like enzyme n=1 Tax=Virgibacillus litoralis TaxID=578221 RepID=A0ABS4HDQ5_9BACI|nr:hypothetical protein [Virgibacillus litoralis]MBP1949041.1 thiamine kinase-like enzyme [Virgibacillus litoralis]